MRDHEPDRLPDSLARAVELMRQEEAPSAKWRGELLRRAAAERSSAQWNAARRVTLSVPWAIAAGLLCAVVGGAAAFGVVRYGVSDRGAARLANNSNVSDAGGGTMLPVTFSVVAPNAASVSIVGDFNRWNPTALPMRRSADGRTWQLEVRLPLGLYAYAFMIDGRLSPDPAAPHTAADDFGTPNSMVVVRGS